MGKEIERWMVEFKPMFRGRWNPTVIWNDRLSIFTSAIFNCETNAEIYREAMNKSSVGLKYRVVSVRVLAAKAARNSGGKKKPTKPATRRRRKSKP